MIRQQALPLLSFVFRTSHLCAARYTTRRARATLDEDTDCLGIAFAVLVDVLIPLLAKYLLFEVADGSVEFLELH